MVQHAVLSTNLGDSQADFLNLYFFFPCIPSCISFMSNISFSSFYLSPLRPPRDRLRPQLLLLLRGHRLEAAAKGLHPRGKPGEGENILMIGVVSKNMCFK